MAGEAPIRLLVLAICVALAAGGCDSDPNDDGSRARDVLAPVAWFGVNLAGAEFGESNMPGLHGQHYVYPSHTSLDYYTSRGIYVVRLPFRWERMQRELYGPLDAEELGRMDVFLAGSRMRDVRVILDAHNYGRRHVGAGSHIIGSDEVPIAAFADFWQKLAAHYADHPAVWAYGLSNEPHDMGSRSWFDAAQAAIDSIRVVDMNHVIMIGGDSWSSAARWRQASDHLKHLTDPADLLVYEAHQYFDDDHSGTYNQDYAGEGGSPQLGVARVKPFVDWLKENGKRGFIGEFGIPDDDPRWNEVLHNFLAYLKSEGVGGTYWAGGPWWGNYRLGIEPRNGADRPQMEVLTAFTM